MRIVSLLDMVLLKKKIKSKDLAAAIGVSEQSLSVLKTGKSNGIRFTTLAAICNYLNCQPGDLYAFERDDAIK